MPHSIGSMPRPRKMKPVQRHHALGRLGALGREDAHRRRLPAGVQREPEQRLPHEERDAELRIGDGIEAAVAHHGRDLRDDVVPPRERHGVDGDEDRRDREQHVLDEVRDDDRDHAAEHGVDELEQEDDGHHGDEMARVDAADDGEELALDPEEHAHVEDAADRDEHARDDAQAPAVADLEVLGHRHQLEIAEATDDEPRAADEDHDEARDERRGEGGESVLVAELAVVHERDRADLGRRQRRDADVEAELAPRHEVVRDVADVTLADEDRRRPSRRGIRRRSPSRPG